MRYLQVIYQKPCWNSRNLTKFFTLNPNIVETLCHSLINNTILWKCVMGPFRCIYRYRYIALTELDFPELSIKLQKMHILGQCTENNFGRKHGNETVFFIYFSRFNCNIHFVFKNSQDSFSFSPLWSILVCKIPHFWAKATDSDIPS